VNPTKDTAGQLLALKVIEQNNLDAAAQPTERGRASPDLGAWDRRGHNFLLIIRHSIGRHVTHLALDHHQNP
jgi:hypothetical protein